MTTRSMLIPNEIVVQGEFWGPGDWATQEFEGKVLALVTDSGGEMWAVFETDDQAGLQIISLGSRFFLGFGWALRT